MDLSFDKEIQFVPICRVFFLPQLDKNLETVRNLFDVGGTS